MSALLQGQDLTQLFLGRRVDKASASLPQTAVDALFNVVGGRVAITQLVGEVTTVIETKANNTKLVANPTTGSDVDLCAVLDITADEAGTLYSISGLAGDALIGSAAGGVGGQARRVIVAPGTIDLNCAASSTGATKWTVFYVPVDDGAYMSEA